MATKVPLHQVLRHGAHLGWLMVLCVAGIVPHLSAADKTWSGLGADTNWTTVDNWSPNTAPGGSDTIVFSGTSTTSAINGDKTVAGLRFAGTGTHVISLGTGGGVIGTGSGGVRVEGNQTVTFNVWIRPTTSGAFSMYNDGTLTLNNSNFQTTAQSTTTFDGSGTTTITKFSRRRADYDLTVVKTGTGTLIITGSENTLALPDPSGVPGYVTGDFTVNNGTLLANNSDGSATGGGNVTVNANGKFGGTGSITGGASKTITLNSGMLLVGATHGAGGSAQDFQLGSSSTFALGGVTSTNVSVALHGTLQFDLTGTGSLTAIGTESYDTLANNDLLRIITTGSVDLGNSSVSLAAANTTGWAEGQTWKLIDWSATTVGSLTTTNLQLSTTSIGSWFLIPTLVSTGSGAGYYVTASAVPEPGRAGLVLLAACVVLMQRRRRAGI